MTIHGLLGAMVGAAVAAFRSRSNLVAENLALRQQLAVLRVGRRPLLRRIDRAFWVVLSRLWSRSVDVIAIVKPATVIGWHRRGFRGSGRGSPRSSLDGPVRVVADPAERTVSVVSAGGHRIEGLTLQEAVAALRGLG
jgi:hypothetical protein